MDLKLGVRPDAIIRQKIYLIVFHKTIRLHVTVCHFGSAVAAQARFPHADIIHF
jgi:hypothetical protein